VAKFTLILIREATRLLGLFRRCPLLAHTLTVAVPDREISAWLHYNEVAFREFSDQAELSGTVLTNHTNQISGYEDHLKKITEFVQSSGTLVLQEPEYGVTGLKTLQVLEDLSLLIQYWREPDRSCCDSYVFPAAENSVLWRNIPEDHLQMLNSAVGGEIVSQHQVRPSKPFRMLAAWNMHLREPAVMEIPYGEGMVIESRIQVRGRLIPIHRYTDFYDRRYNPVAERYFRNLITNDYHHDRKNLRELILSQ